MRKLFGEILATRTVRDSAVTFAGTLITGALGLSFYILLARFLGPTNFGIFSVSVLALTLTADIATVGTDTGIVRFVGKYFASERDKALKFLKLALKTKAVVSAFLIAGVWFLIPTVAENLLRKPEFTVPLRIALVGSASALLFSFVTSAIQAVQKFFAWSALTVGMNGLRLLVILFLFALGSLSLNLSLVTYSLIPLLGFGVGLFLLPNFLKARGENSVAREFFNYNKWIAVFTAFAALSSRLDSFISTRLLSLEEVGIYSVAVSLSSLVPQIVFALGVVAAPKLASFNSEAQAFEYLKKLQVFVAGLCIVGLLVGIPLSFFFIPTFYGAAYVGSIQPFIILLVAQAVFLFSVPVHTGIIYYFSFPKLFVWVTLVNLAIVGGAGWFLITRFGIMGAASAILIGDISNFLIPAVWILRKFRRNV